jgi:signal peptidase I
MVSQLCLKLRSFQRLRSPPPKVGVFSIRFFSSSHDRKSAYSLSNYYKLYNETSEIFRELSTLASRILAAFGILHVITEYGIDLTRCEGPSMMPTIKPHGEIIIIEKVSHRLYGLQGGCLGEQRAKEARLRQKEWEIQEHKTFLTVGKRNSVYEPTWYKRKLPEANHENHSRLSSLKQMLHRFTSGIDVGDVVVLEHPDREGTVCKRVLGLPGDIILRPKHDTFYLSSNHRDVLEVFEEDTDGGGEGNAAYLSNSSLEVVPDGHIWVEGDNSVNSADSRHYGPVSSALVVGKVWFRIWPLRGDAFMVRGGRPMPPKNAPFTGSTVIPAGCEGEKIVPSS